MTDKQLLKIVQQFRKGILGKSTPANKCFMVSSPLCAYLQMTGIETDLTECEITQGDDVHGHWFLTLKDGRIIDPTASQFYNSTTGETMPEIYFGERPYWYQPVKKQSKRA